MTKPMIRIHNTETDEIIDRQMTDAEYKAYEAEAKAYDDLLAKTAQALTDKAAAQAKLEALGLTVEDLQALGL